MKRLVLLCITLLCVLLSGCDMSSSNSLIGTWKNDTDEMRFLEDGKLYYESALMDYQVIDDEEVMYTTPTGVTFIFQFEIKNDVLTLSYLGDSITFERVKEK